MDGVRITFCFVEMSVILDNTENFIQKLRRLIEILQTKQSKHHATFLLSLRMLKSTLSKELTIQEREVPITRFQEPG
jgi:hypothetical protein